MKKTTLAMVAVLAAAVAMLSAGLVVPMQQAIASNDGGDGDGDTKIKLKQKNECGENFLALTECTNTADIRNRDMNVGN
jgi:hypothetical protein